MDIRWKRGEFRKFFAKMKIRVGSVGNAAGGVIQEGDEFEYDGSILKYAGAELQSTQLRGAVLNDWVTIDENDTSGAEAFVAERRMAKSQTVNRDLSRVQRNERGSLGVDSLDEETVMEVSARGKMENSSKSATPKVLTSKNYNKSMIKRSAEDDQEGVVVGRVRSAAKIKVDVAAKPFLAKDIENRGVGRPELIRKHVTETEGVTITTNVGNVDTSINMSDGDENGGKIVGTVRHSKVSTEGMDIKDTSNIKNKKTELKINENLPIKVKIARKIDENFPANWSFTGKLKDRLDAVKLHGESSKFLDALYAAEGDQMRQALTKAYPKQFK